MVEPEYSMFFEILQNPEGNYFWRLKDSSGNVMGYGEPTRTPMVAINGAALLQHYAGKAPIYDENGEELPRGQALRDELKRLSEEMDERIRRGGGKPHKLDPN